MWETIVERWRFLTTEQKVSLVILGICGVLAMGLSVYHIRNTIRAPFMVDRSEVLKAKKVIGETDEEKLAHEKRTDTDGDGLSDWDESNVYHTNPNLRDSCGDGIADNVRVATGKNLVCLNSPNAGGNLDYSQVETTSTGFGLPDGVGLQNQEQGALGSASGTLPVGDVSAQAAGVMQRSPDSIRQALLSSGKVNADEVNKLTDQELLDIYDAAVEADTQSLNPNGSTETQTTPSGKSSSGELEDVVAPTSTSRIK